MPFVPARPRHADQPGAPDGALLANRRPHGQRAFRPARAQEYLESRGLRTRALWRAFKLGYSSGSVAELAGTEETNDVRRLLVELGILARDAEGRVHERMKGRLVFPLVAFNQLPVGLYGRAIDEALDPHHLFLPGPRRGLFNWNAARRSKEILLVESVLDALSLIEAGVGNAIPLYGIHGLTDDHKELVKRCGLESVVVALDADEAGRKATPRLLDLFEKLGVKARAIEWPEKDPNDLLVRHGPEKTRDVVAQLLSPALARDATVTPAVNPLPLTADVAREEAPPPRESAAKEENTQPQPSGLSRAELLGEVLVLTSGDRLWRVVWSDTHSPSHLRATLRVRLGEASDAPGYLDSLDLVTARARETFARKAAASTGLADPLPLQRALEADLMRIAAIGEERRKAAETKDAVSIAMSEPARARALELLRAKDLLSRIARDLEAAGYVGEETNKLIGYLVGISRKLDMPLSMVILSPSGSGKSGLADALEALTPEEDFFSLSSLTAQALFYMPKDKLVRKFILIEERAGSIEADYSIRALQSKKKLTRAVPVKDPATGKIETKIFEILGPAAFLETTTESRINIENATRCFEIHLDESPEQTERIQRAQRRSKTFEGLRDRESRDEILRLHHDAQRLLRTISVVIPFAEAIEFPIAWLRTRRDNLRFLHLIEALAFLRQYQRPIVGRGTTQPLGKSLEELSGADASGGRRHRHARRLRGGLRAGGRPSRGVAAGPEETREGVSGGDQEPRRARRRGQRDGRLREELGALRRRAGRLLAPRGQGVDGPAAPSGEAALRDAPRAGVRRALAGEPRGRRPVPAHRGSPPCPERRPRPPDAGRAAEEAGSARAAGPARSAEAGRRS